MKKQLLLLSAICVLACAGIQAQNADLDQKKIDHSASISYKTLVNPQTIYKGPLNQLSSNCAPASMCPQTGSNSGSVRGYYFVAPVSFILCGLLVPTDMSTGPQSIEVLRFHGMLPPAYPALTNNFTSLFYVASDTNTLAPVACNIPINAGDTIGIYGARSTGTVCSYAMAQCVTSILGNSVTLYRSGMQFPLYNQQMHDVWSEVSGSISRVVMYVDSAATSISETTLNASLVTIAPNPSNGIFTVNIRGVKDLTGSEKLSIYNIMGEKIYESYTDLSKSIDLSDKPDGVYFLRIKTGQRTVIKKIILNR